MGLVRETTSSVEATQITYRQYAENGESRFLVKSHYVLTQGPQRVKQGTLPLRNDPEKRNLFFNTMVCSSKEFGTRISENVWPFP